MTKKVCLKDETTIKNDNLITIDYISDIIKQKFPTMPLHKFNHLVNKIKLMNFNDLLMEVEEIIYPNCHPGFWNF